MARFEVRFTNYATEDLFEIYRYNVEENSFAYADKLIDRLKDACSSLARFPKRGHPPHEFELLDVSDYHEIHCGAYRIIYEIAGQAVFIYAIIHMKRDVFDLLKARLLR